MALLALIWWGTQLVFSGVVTAGALTQFMVYALLAAGAMTNLSEVWSAIAIVSGATERLFDILDVEPDHRLAGRTGRPAATAAGDRRFRACRIRL